MRTHLAAPLSALAASLLVLTACSGDDGGEAEADRTPAEVLEAAGTAFDETSGLRISIATDDLPEGVEGMLSADGYGTHDPAFDGTLVVRFAGFEPEVPVVAVDGVVYAQVPLTTGWSEIDPDEYGAPDPARLLSTDEGFSSLIGDTAGLEEGEQQRSEQDTSVVVTTYTGSLTGDSVSRIIPTAEGDFDVTYTVSDGDELRSMELTGDFYGAEPMTYTIGFSEYGAEPDITAPE